MRSILFISTLLGFSSFGAGQTYGWIQTDHNLTVAIYSAVLIDSDVNTSGTSALITCSGSWPREAFRRGEDNVTCPWTDPFAGTLFDGTDYLPYNESATIPPMWTLKVKANYTWTYGNEAWTFVPPPPSYHGETEHGDVAPPPNNQTGPWSRTYSKTTSVTFIQSTVAP